ncbi:hypothetical protein CHS0354_020116 [Potamilus streckersoni]|uniref:N-acetyltransferase domain-containing protein n=1 Tax=Potamilus streckersoni TaxID=2493646 RepID=A0AAE0VPF6_9BIVA|nr:hypothetical protein CHS0354_020116 [Potamilus streckersoni]
MKAKWFAESYKTAHPSCSGYDLMVVCYASESNSDLHTVKYEIRPMRRCDIQGLYNLTSENNWNMEKSYLECIFNTDPSGLVIVVKNDGEVIGHNGILAHGKDVASSGMNIVKEKYRKLGIGRKLFHAVMEVMKEKNVGGTALSNRITFYQQFGWTIKSYTFHYSQGPVNPNFVKDFQVEDLEIVPASYISFDDVIVYDSELHTVPRPVYISNWAESPIAKTYVALKSGRICGYGVLRPADVGYRMYPLYADNPSVAKALFCKLASYIPQGQDVIFTQPVDNEYANDFVAGNKLRTYLSMTRLYNKKNIVVDIKRVYSVSSTEYGII